MRIWVDADACPRVCKEILYRAAERVKIVTTLVANQPLQVPPSRWIKATQVPGGFDVADNYIVQQVNENDLVITADVPLAAEIIERGAHALNPRGDRYSRENIRQRLAMRDMMEELRNTGQVSGGPPPYGQQERQTFANALDRLLTRHHKIQ